MSQNASSWKKRVTNALGNTCICLSHWMSRVDKTEFLCDSSAAVFSRLASSQDWLASFMILAAPDIRCLQSWVTVTGKRAFLFPDSHLKSYTWDFQVILLLPSRLSQNAIQFLAQVWGTVPVIAK